RQLRVDARRRHGRRVRRGVQPRRAETFPPLRAGDRGSLMARIEDYGLIGDLQTAALVGRDGSIDWACFPRFDSGACFAALLGTTDQGRWLIAPRGDAWSVDRRYREGTLILETDWETDAGRVRVIDFMPPRGKAPDIVRIVEGLEGEVEMDAELVIRFDYGSTLPWVRRIDGGTRVPMAGPDALCFRRDAEHRGENMRTLGEFTVRQGDRVAFTLTWYPSNEDLPEAIDAEQALQDTVDYWEGFVRQCKYDGKWKEAVHRSLMVLKALTYAPTGGIVAAATTSLPEKVGGERNWDYRYCWLRDATLVLLAFINAGYHDEARAWRLWLLRAAAGDPAELQIMYGVGGERRLTELTFDWLPGYEASRPVRAGNAASEHDLYRDGFVYRYAGDEESRHVDGLPPGEGAFLPCTFWLADNLALQGRMDEAEELFERLLGLSSDLGLFAEEWDPDSRRQ